MPDETSVQRVERVLADHLPSRLYPGGLAAALAERIVRTLDQPEPFKADDVAHVMVSARFKCPCAAGDVLTQSIMVPFEISELDFQYVMKEWWLELKHEVRAHMAPGGRFELKRPERGAPR